MKTLLEEKDIPIGTKIIALRDGENLGKEEPYYKDVIYELYSWYENYNGSDNYQQVTIALKEFSNIVNKTDFAIYNSNTLYEIFN